MGYVLLGHGSLNADPLVTRRDMEIVAIPQGTTIQFYADAGQALYYDSRDLDAWDRLQAPWPPVDSRRVTYNLSLSSAREDWAAELQNHPTFGGNKLIRPGVDGFPDPFRLCTGTRRTCPVRPEQVAAGAEHHCNGILRHLRGSDLHWLACTTIRNADRSVLEAANAGRRRSVVLGDEPDWMPDEFALQAVAEANRTALERAYDGEVLACAIAGSLFVIGEGHAPQHQNYALYEDGSVDCGLTVRKEGAWGVIDGVEVEGVPPDLQDVVRSTIARFSDTAVRFI